MLKAAAIVPYHGLGVENFALIAKIERQVIPVHLRDRADRASHQ